MLASEPYGLSETLHSADYTWSRQHGNRLFSGAMLPP